MDIPISCARIEMQRGFSFLLGERQKASPSQKYHKSGLHKGAKFQNRGARPVLAQRGGGTATVLRWPSKVYIQALKETINPSQIFEFKPVLVEEISNQTNRLDPKKATPSESIPAKTLKGNSAIF